MAQAPRLRGLKVEDFPEVPEAFQATFKALVESLNPALNDTATALSGRLAIGDNVSGVYKTVDIAAVEAPWTAPTLLNSWTNYDATANQIGYRMLPGGIVEVRGAVKRLAGAPVAFTALATLPVGYRPALTYLFTGATGGAYGRIDVQADGDLAWGAGDVTILSLDQIRFQATTPAAPPAFVGPGWPITLSHGLTSSPKFVAVASARDIAAGSNIALAGTPAWQLDAKGQVVVRRVEGLTPGRKYRLTFLILP